MQYDVVALMSLTLILVRAKLKDLETVVKAMQNVYGM